jgi:hypothetical protein
VPPAVHTNHALVANEMPADGRVRPVPRRNALLA